MKPVKRLAAGFSLFVLAVLVLVLALHRDSAVTTEIDINSPPQAVWKVLTATADYPAWNPLISRFDGPLVPGRKVMFVSGTGSDSMTFRPTLLVVRAPHELCWKGNVWVPGIFDGEHRFTLVDSSHGTHFVQSERFTGLFVGRLTQSILQDTAVKMQAMNAALRNPR